jgi:hypothetical protein
MPNPKQMSMAEQPFNDADDCAMAALDEINPASNKKNVEFAGRIYRKADGKFYFTRPVQGTRDDSQPPPTPHGATAVGTYHTHAGNFVPTDEEFSPNDLLKAVMAKEYSWLETPLQQIKRFTPISLCVDGNFDPKISGRVDVLRNTLVLPVITFYGVLDRDAAP